VVTVAPGLSDAVVVIAGEATTDASCTIFHGGTSDGWIAEINLDDGSIVKSDCVGGGTADSIRAVEASTLGDVYRVYGWTTSDMTGDIGASHDDANHHGDIMLGTWSSAEGASVWCYGSIGSDSALFLLDDNLVAAMTNGGANGDFEAFPNSDPNSSLFLSLSPSEPCVDATCVAPTWVLNPGLATVLVGGSDSWLAANAEQIEGALGCPDASFFETSALIARYDSGTLVDTVCLGAPGTTTSVGGIGSSSDAIAIVGNTSGYDIAPFVGATIDGTVEPLAGPAAFIALYGKVPSIASEPSEIVLVKAARAVSLGAVAIRDDGCVIAAGSTTEGPQPDVFVYSRSITP
jgi:hypothetical protein